MTFENDQDAPATRISPPITGGDVVVFDDITQVETSNTDPLAATTAGTLGYRFNLDTVSRHRRQHPGRRRALREDGHPGPRRAVACRRPAVLDGR